MSFGLVASFLLGFAFSLSFWASPLVADENFMVFSFSYEFFTEPSRIFYEALKSSVAGWEYGRFVSPLMHVFGTFGNAFTYGVSELLSVDLLTAYSFGRSIVFACVTTLVYALSWRLIPVEIGQLFRHVGASTTVLAFLISAVSNSEFSSIRIFPWGYSIVIGLVLILAIGALELGRAESRKGLSVGLVFATIFTGILTGSTYELTQALGPAIVLAFAWGRIGGVDSRAGKKLDLSPLRQFSGLYSLLLSYLISAGIIRASSFLTCRDIGCYSPGDVRPDQIEPIQIFERFLSGSPVFSISFAVSEYDLSSYFSTSAWFSATIAVAFFLYIWFYWGRFYFRLGQNLPAIIVRRASASLFLGGLSTSSLLALGMAASAALQSSENIAIGKSLIDTFGQSIGHGMLLASGILAVSHVARRTRSLRLIVKAATSSVLSLLLTMSFIVNSGVTNSIKSSPSVSFQSAFAAHLENPQLGSSGDELRCQAISSKLSDYPEWEGHDRMLVYGLNMIMNSRHGIPFCASSIDDLFEDYPK